ncbi:MAG: hypothetical protein WCA10_05295 [Terracidiphilus sp.]
MPKRKKPGEIRFKVTSKGGGGSASTERTPEVARDDPPTYLRFIPFTLLGVAFLILVAVLSGDNGTASKSSVAPPSVNNLSVPARPTYPGYNARFVVKHVSKPSGTESEGVGSGSLQSLIFSYEHLHVIFVTNVRQIPISIRREAFTFGLGTREHTAYAQIIYPQSAFDAEVLSPSRHRATVDDHYFDATLGPTETEDLNHTATGDVASIFNGRLPGVPTNASAPEDRQMKNSLSPYIIYGDVAVTFGSLVDNDYGYLSGVLEAGSFSALEVDLYHRGPRGPPSTEFMISHEKDRLARKVYVVGRLETIHGPDQFKHSFMRTHIVDLGPSKTDLKNFRSNDQHWQESTAALASYYNVGVNSIRAFAGREVDIYDGKVERSPTAEEIRQREEKERVRILREEERARQEQFERAERVEVP